MALWKKKRKIEDKVEARFQQVVDLFKDLDKKEFKRLIDGIQLAWEGYYKIRQIQTTEDKEMADVSKIEKEITEYKEDLQ